MQEGGKSGSFMLFPVKARVRVFWTMEGSVLQPWIVGVIVVLHNGLNTNFSVQKIISRFAVTIFMFSSTKYESSRIFEIWDTLENWTQIQFRVQCGLCECKGISMMCQNMVAPNKKRACFLDSPQRYFPSFPWD